MSEQPDPAAEGGGGVCGSCGRELPAPDLEAVAASIDQTLSLESGRMVPRTAWAGRPPDGAVDALFSWLPSVKSKKHTWERGQQLWTEQMTAALSGPCDDCRAAETSMAPTGTPGQAPDPRESAPPAGFASQPPPSYDSATAMMSVESSPSPPESSPWPYQAEEGRTTAMPAYSEPDAPADAPTSAVPSFSSGSSGFGGPTPATPAARSPEPPLPPGDEHESHTMILSSLPSIRTTTRLVVLDGPVHGRQFSLGRQMTTIGRSIGCHVTVESDAVAYDHARIVRTPEGWQIEMIGDAAETLVNSQPIRQPHTLRNGDVVTIGPARLRFESTGQASS